MRTSGIIVIIIIALLAVLGLTVGTGVVGDNNNHQNVSDMLPDNLESNTTVKINDNGTYTVIDNNTHKVIHTVTKNKTIVTPENNSKDDAIELQSCEYMRVDPSDNMAPNIKIDSHNPPELLSPAEIIKQNDLSTDEIVTMYIYDGGGQDDSHYPLYEINTPFYSYIFDATTGECVGGCTIEDLGYVITGDLDNELNSFIKSKTDVWGVYKFYNQLKDIAHQKLVEENNLTYYYLSYTNPSDVPVDISEKMDITNKGNGSTYTFVSNVGNVTLDSDKNILNISVVANDITKSDNIISKEEAINIVKPDVIEHVKEYPGPDFVSRMTFRAMIMEFGNVYKVETFIDGNHFMTTWVDARTGEIVNSIGIGDGSSGIREDGTWGPLTEEEYNKKHNITIDDTDSFNEVESIENGT
ncbi:MAG: hypothetical protein BZ135_08435 [Methanosphaera sp. rholeuAM6]|nr:MAG: hypothetical protein BZ135_08435 [Methanosphaera sp. rholeuAM6]